MDELRIDIEALTPVLNTLKKRSKHGRVASYVAMVIHQPGILTLYHNDDVVFSIVRLRIDPETTFPKEMIFNLSELLQCISISSGEENMVSIPIVIKEGDPYFVFESGILFLSTYNMNFDMFTPPVDVKIDSRKSDKITLVKTDFVSDLDRLRSVLKSSDNMLLGSSQSIWTYKSDMIVEIDRDFAPINLHVHDLLLLNMFPSDSFYLSYGDTYACLQDSSNQMYVFIPLRSAMHQEYNIESEALSIYSYNAPRVYQVLVHGTAFAHDSGMVQLTGDKQQVRCRLLNVQFKKNSLLVLTDEVNIHAEKVTQFFTEVSNLLGGLSVFKNDEKAVLEFRKDCLIIRNQEDSIRVTILNRNMGTWL